MYLRRLIELFETVRNEKISSRKQTIVQEHFETFREISNFQSQENYLNFFQILRLILPNLDRSRPAYNMKESKITKTIIKMLNLPAGPDRNNLSKYDIASVNSNKIDFGDVVYSVLRKYISHKQSQMSVADLNVYLDKIANRKTDTGLDEKCSLIKPKYVEETYFDEESELFVEEKNLNDIMLEMFRKSAPEENKWIIRIILKDLKLGIDGNRILNIYHKDAARFYASNNNLKKVCEVLWSPSIKLHEFEISLFEPFRPMLSKRCNANSFLKDFQHSKMFFVENKFDGERFQLHMEDGKFKFFSRNGFDFTEQFGDSYNTGLLAPKLKDVFHNDVKKVLLDGEMMLWNKKSRKFGSKGLTFDVKKLSADGYYQPCFCVFDVLLINEKILTNKPLQERLKLLRKIIKHDITGTLLVSNYSEAHCCGDIIDALNISMDHEEEGIIVKDQFSIYKYSDRNSGWFKLKMEYFDDVVNDLDVVVMGGCYQAHSKKLNSFLIGISTGISDEYFSFAKVSSGLNYEELEMLNKRFTEKGHPFNSFKSSNEDRLHFGKEVPDIWIKPEDSLIFTVRATELTRNNDETFRTPYTLRFARVLKIRNDKPPNECLNMNELGELTKQNKSIIKLNRRHIELEEISKAKRPSRMKKALITDIDSLQKTSNFLEGLKFFVFSGSEEFTKIRIETLIMKSGGSIALTPDSNINIMLIGNINPKIKVYMKQINKYDIIRTCWLKRVLEKNALLRYQQHEVMSLGQNFDNSFSYDVDIYGDSFIEIATVESLKNRFDLMKDMGIFTNQNNTISLRGSSLTFDIHLVYFDKYEVINNPSSGIKYNSFLDEMELMYRKGNVSEILTSDVTLIITETNDENRRALLVEYLHSIGQSNYRIIPRTDLYCDS